MPEVKSWSKALAAQGLYSFRTFHVGQFQSIRFWDLIISLYFYICDICDLSFILNAHVYWGFPKMLNDFTMCLYVVIMCTLWHTTFPVNYIYTFKTLTKKQSTVVSSWMSWVGVFSRILMQMRGATFSM